jgi:D-alanine-D-alanine ligase-like ATP-grasp enzyme
VDEAKFSVLGMLKTIAPEINAKIIVEPEYEKVGVIVFGSGKKQYFKNTTFNANPFASSEIAGDKHYTNFFLGRLGYSVPVEQTFFSTALNNKLTVKRTIHDGFRYAAALGFPVIIKPNNMSKGRMVAKVYNQDEYYDMAMEIFTMTDVLLVQKYYGGSDFRILVLNGKVYAAYKREPLTLVGDGVSTVHELLMGAERELKDRGRNVKIDCGDKRFMQILNRLGYSYSSVPEKNQSLRVSDAANLSSGGRVYDYTPVVHDDFRRLAVEIAGDMGLKFCGVDVITDDLSRPLKEYVVLEINASPGLAHFSSLGTEQFEIVKKIYLDMLRLLEGG